jgi:hypothetical protein
MSKTPDSVARSSSRCYAFLLLDGTIDLDSIGESEEAVRWNMIEQSMGWRFNHPERYDREKEWQRLLAFGKVIPVLVCIESA